MTGGHVPVGRLLADLAPPEALRALELAIVRRLEGYLRGEHLGLLPGPGSELAEARMYRPGEDDVRHMDWAVTAPTTHPHVRDVVPDRELETYALVDLSGSMQFGTSGPGTRGLAGIDAAFGGPCPTCGESVVAFKGDSDAVADSILAWQDMIGSEGVVGSQSSDGRYLPLDGPSGGTHHG